MICSKIFVTDKPSPVILEFDKEPDLGEAVLRKGFAEEIAKFHKASNDQNCVVL